MAEADGGADMDLAAADEVGLRDGHDEVAGSFLDLLLREVAGEHPGEFIAAEATEAGVAGERRADAARDGF